MRNIDDNDLKEGKSFSIIIVHKYNSELNNFEFASLDLYGKSLRYTYFDSELNQIKSENFYVEGNLSIEVYKGLCLDVKLKAILFCGDLLAIDTKIYDSFKQYIDKVNNSPESFILQDTLNSNLSIENKSLNHLCLDFLYQEQIEMLEKELVVSPSNLIIRCKLLDLFVLNIFSQSDQKKFNYLIEKYNNEKLVFQLAKTKNKKMEGIKAGLLAIDIEISIIKGDFVDALKNLFELLEWMENCPCLNLQWTDDMEIDYKTGKITSICSVVFNIIQIFNILNLHKQSYHFQEKYNYEFEYTVKQYKSDLLTMPSKFHMYIKENIYRYSHLFEITDFMLLSVTYQGADSSILYYSYYPEPENFDIAFTLKCKILKNASGKAIGIDMMTLWEYTNNDFIKMQERANLYSLSL